MRYRDSFLMQHSLQWSMRYQYQAFLRDRWALRNSRTFRNYFSCFWYLAWNFWNRWGLAFCRIYSLLGSRISSARWTGYYFRWAIHGRETQGRSQARTLSRVLLLAGLLALPRRSLALWWSFSWSLHCHLGPHLSQELGIGLRPCNIQLRFSLVLSSQQ